MSDGRQRGGVMGGGGVGEEMGDGRWRGGMSDGRQRGDRRVGGQVEEGEMSNLGTRLKIIHKKLVYGTVGEFTFLFSHINTAPRPAAV